MNAENDFDQNSIAKIQQMLGGEYQRLANNILTNIGKSIDLISEALKCGNRPDAIEAAHKMKSGCGQFGLLNLERLARAIEYNESPDVQALTALCVQMRPAYEQAVSFLQKNGLNVKR